ncbi:MAG: hypothetical protein QNJ30_08650 [Kiloniellales bacterium]|nr:hypothetical protein [Kiloniellales bacterium]
MTATGSDSRATGTGGAPLRPRWSPLRRAAQDGHAALLCLLLAGLLFAGAAFVGLVAEPGAPGSGRATFADSGPQAALAQGNLPAGPKRSHRIRHHVDNAEAACLPITAERPATRQQREIAALIRDLRRSAQAVELLRTAAGRNVIVCLDADTPLLAYYFSGLRLIGLRRSLSRAERLIYLSHELAHVPQHPAFSDNRYFPPEDLVLLRRVREAAAEATATRIAWQLARAGLTEVWKAKRAGVYGDLAVAFADAMERGQDAAAELRATRAAFDRWFAKAWRLDTYDRMTVDHLARIAADEFGLVAPRLHLSHGMLVGIGRQGARNFLSETEGRSLTDPFYRGTLSPANSRDLEAVVDPAEEEEVLALNAWS